MLRLVHTADVHLGARHADLGEQAAAQRERQFAAFKASVDLALAEKVDLFLVAGDLFDSNVQPRRSVERVAAELERLAASKIRSILVPGTHDCYDRSSLYRAYDLAAMSGSTVDDGLVTVLTPERPFVHLRACDVVVYGPVFATKRAPHSPLRDVAAARVPEATYHVGLLHGSLAIPGRTDRDDVVVTSEEIAATNLDYLALGHWHSTQQGKAGTVTYAYAGAPEPVALDQDGAGQVLIVELERRGDEVRVSVKPMPVGRTRFEKIELDAAAITSQGELERTLRERAGPDSVLDVRLVGMKSDDLDLNVDELERQLQGAFLRLRVRDSSIVSLPDTPLAPADTILGAFAREFGSRIVDHENRGDTERAAELREALRLGILLLDDPQRVTLA